MPPTNEILLHVIGLGHVPNFKNQKMLTRGRLITKPERQKWMERCVQSFVSQLRSYAVTEGKGIWTGRWSPSLIVSSLPEDDCRQCIPQITLQAVEVAKGEEGAVIKITKL